MEALRDLADDFNVRDPRKLYQLARQRDLDVTQAMAFEALQADVGRQVQAPRPRALGKSAAEGPNDRLQADLIDFSQNTRGKTKYGLVVMDQGWKHLDFYIKKIQGPAQRGTESTRRLMEARQRKRDGMHKDPAKLAQEFTQPHFYTPPAKKSWRAEKKIRLQGKLQANRGCVTLQRRGCRSNSGLAILRRTRSFPERTSSAGSVAAILWQLETFMYRRENWRLSSSKVLGWPTQRHRRASLSRLTLSRCLLCLRLRSSVLSSSPSRLPLPHQLLLQSSSAVLFFVSTPEANGRPFTITRGQ